MIFGLFGALAATSRSAGGALYTLYTHTDQLAQLIRDPALIPDAIEECLRIASNGYFTFARIATRDTEVGGTRNPQGHGGAAVAARGELRSRCLPRSAALRHPSQAETDLSALPSGRTIASATSSAAPPSPSRSAGCWRASPNARLVDPDFVPVYGGSVGELRLQSLPMRIQ